MGRSPKAAGNPNLGAPRGELPTVHEVAEHLAVESNPPNLDLLRVSQPHLVMHVGQRDVEVLHHPGVLVVVGDLELDGQRSIRPASVLPYEAIRLQPTGERCLGAIDAGRLIEGCLLYTSDAADDLTRVDLGGRRIIKKKKKIE